jgi:hypothetical protein
MYRAYFNDGQCTGPYGATDDEMALGNNPGKSKNPLAFYE